MKIFWQQQRYWQLFNIKKGKFEFQDTLKNITTLVGTQVRIIT